MPEPDASALRPSSMSKLSLVVLVALLGAGCAASVTERPTAAASPQASAASASSSPADIEQRPDGSIPGVPCSDDQTDELGYGGLTEQEARARAVAESRRFRLSCVDGRVVPGEMDNDPSRVNVALQDGRVVASAGG